MQITDGSITEYHEGYTVENKLFTYSEEERQEQEINKMNAELILKPQFIPVNPKMLQDGYSPIEAMIYGFMSFFLSNNEKFYCTNEQLAKMLNTSEKTVSLAINKLKEKGLINISYKMRAGGGKTRFVHLATLQKVMSDFTKCNVATLPKHTNIENKEIENKIIEEKIKRKGYGEFKKCLLSDEEYEKVITDYGLKNGTILINKVDNYCASKGKAYKNYVAAIRNFAKTANINKLPAPIQTNNSIRENDIYLQEFLKCD